MMKAAIVLTILCVARAQDNELISSTETNDGDDTEKRFTSELFSELQTTQDDALLLYTEYSARSGAELKGFIKKLHNFSNETLNSLDEDGSFINQGSSPRCREQLLAALHQIEYKAHRAASFSAENHHKYLLGHMIVFRMHLNKSEEYINKCDRVIQTCGTSCETAPRVIRWQKLARTELHRVKDDILHSRMYYKDILLHSKRKLKHLQREANSKAKEAYAKFKSCF